MGKEIDILNEVDAYCEQVGISRATLGLKALGNARFFDRLERRREKTREDESKIRAFICENAPAATHEKGAA